MKKMQSSIFLTPMFLILAACGAQQEDAGVNPFSQIDPEPTSITSRCPEKYSPISIAGSGTLNTFGEVLITSNLRYSVAETYFEITEADQVIAQGHVIDSNGAALRWKCTNVNGVRLSRPSDFKRSNLG